MVNVGNAQSDWPDYSWNWDTLTETATSLPYTALGDPSVHTATSAASAVGTAGGDDGAASAMDVDAEGVAPTAPVEPPHQVGKGNSRRSNLLAQFEGNAGSSTRTRSQ